MENNNNTIGALIFAAICFYFGYILTDAKQSYEYLENHLDEYNDILFEKAKTEYDPNYNRLHYGLDSLLLEYTDKKILIINK